MCIPAARTGQIPTTSWMKANPGAGMGEWGKERHQTWLEQRGKRKRLKRSRLKEKGRSHQTKVNAGGGLRIMS